MRTFEMGHDLSLFFDIMILVQKRCIIILTVWKFMDNLLNIFPGIDRYKHILHDIDCMYRMVPEQTKMLEIFDITSDFEFNHP